MGRGEEEWKIQLEVVRLNKTMNSTLQMHYQVEFIIKHQAAYYLLKIHFLAVQALSGFIYNKKNINPMS